MNKVLLSLKFYWKYVYYKLINKYSKEIDILPWTTIQFRKGVKNKWYIHIGDRKTKLENAYNCQTVKLFMMKFGFVTKATWSSSPSIFSEEYTIGSSTYNKSDVVKMGLVQKLVDQRIKAAMDNTAKKN